MEMEEKFNKYDRISESDTEELNDKMLWESFYENGKYIRTNLINDIRKKLGSSGVMGFFDESAELGKMIEKNIPDCSKYAAWHILAQSSTKYEEAPKKDFPAPYSIIDFFKKQNKKLESL